MEHKTQKRLAQLFADKLYGEKFWTAGYFYRIVGSVNSSTVNRYVEESQEKHWKEKTKQTQLLEFTFIGSKIEIDI